jgi:hypothetical protein
MTYPKQEPYNAKATEEVEHIGPIPITSHYESGHEGSKYIADLCSSENQGSLARSLVRRHPSSQNYHQSWHSWPLK